MVFFGDKRSLDQALLSYDLAVITSNEILKAERLMANKKFAHTESHLIDARIQLEQIFPCLKRDSSIKAVFPTGM